MRTRLPPSLLGLCFGFSLLTHAFLVRAQAKNGFEFAWLAPEGCPLADEVRTEIDRLLGSPAHAPASGDLTVRASVEHDSLWLVTLETTLAARNGHRTISATSCQGLANATALIVALMIDPDAVAAHSREPEAVRPTVTAPAEPAAPPPVPRSRTTSVLAGIGAAGNLGVLPSPDLGISASLGLAGPFWRVEVRAGYDPRTVQSATMAEPAGAFGRFRLYPGALLGCLVLKRAAWDLGLCLDFEFGAIHGQGFGPPSTSSKTKPWFGLGAGGVVAFRANRWLVFPAHLDAVVPLWRPRFTFDGAETPIFRSAVVGGRLTAGVEAQF